MKFCKLKLLFYRCFSTRHHAVWGQRRPLLSYCFIWQLLLPYVKAALNKHLIAFFMIFTTEVRENRSNKVSTELGAHQDKLGSYGAALKILGLKHLQDVGGKKNNRAECSHVPIRRRERKSQKFRSIYQAQKLLSSHAQIYNLFNHRRHLISRNTLRKFRVQTQHEWNLVTASACA